MLRASAALTSIFWAGTVAAAAVPDAVEPIRNSDDIVVTASKVNAETPITASILTTEPQAIVSRSIIENSVPPTADFSDIILLTPGASSTSTGNGPGLTDSKTTLRGFKDGQFNITYDGVPFGDSNDPTHHSTSYFPNGTFERIIVDRGPGRATDLGQASYGGNIHLISRETTEHASVDIQDVYGSFNTFLQRVGVQSGSIDALGGLKIVAVGEYKQTDGALSYESGWWTNGFIKAELPLGDRAKFSLLSSYNQSLFHQSDAAGGATCFTAGTAGLPAVTPGEVSQSSCNPGSQIGNYGKNFGGVLPAQAGSTLWPSARRDWNWENKTTDIEIARFQADLSSTLSFDNKTYTYFYKNFTISTEDSTTPCTGLVANPATMCSALSTKALGPTGKIVTVAGDIPGYTKLNQYRQSGDIGEFTLVTPIGVGKAGFWYEHSQSKRYRYDYDFTQAFANNAFGDYHFDFAAMANYYNYKEKLVNGIGQPTLQLGGAPVPQYIKYDERTSWDQIQGFGEFEFRLFDDRLKLTPGVKVQNFTRSIDTPIAAQSSREGIVAHETYRPTLPYFTANYLILPNFSTYFQFAKGFLIPSLSSSLESSSSASTQTPVAPLPTKTTNYQAGAVYAGDNLNIDGDVYYIKTSNSSYVDPANSSVTIVNGDPATYKGVEGQISYRLPYGLTAIVNGSLASAKDDVTGLWLVQAPNYTALAGAVLNHGPFRFSYLHKFVGRQYWFVDQAKILPSVRAAGYSLGILSAGYRIGPVEVAATLYNAFNDRSTTTIGAAVAPVGALYTFQSPRSVEGSVRVRF